MFVDGSRYPPQDSPWANPYKVSAKDPSSRQRVLEQYRAYLEARLEREPGLREQLESLRGQKLGCWCHPEPCHGHVLVSMLEPS